MHNSRVRVEGWRTNLSGPVPDVRRIVSVSPSNTEILHALGLGRRIVGVDRWSDYPPRVTRLPRVGSDLHVDVERVLELQPELVLASLHVPGMEDNIPLFDQAGVPYLAVGGVGLDGVWTDMRLIGRYLGRESRAEALISVTQARMATIAASVTRGKRPRVHWEWSAHPFVAAKRSWITELLEMVGAENVWADLDVESVRVAPDEAIARQPEVVVACWCGVRKLPDVSRVLARPGGWQATPAFRDRRVAVLSEAFFGRPGPRLAVGLEQLAAIL
jgi:iron complex transport system substrate-binding protein